MAKQNNAAKEVFSIDYVASPTCSRFHKDKSFIRGIRGPIGSGKSICCCLEIFTKACSMTPSKDGIRRSRWAVVRNTQPQLETTTIKSWLDWFPEHIFGKMSRKPPFTHKVKHDDVELEVIFLALDKPDDIKKLLSLEVTGIWFNEAREISKKIVDAGSGRVGRFPSKKDCPIGVDSKNFPNWSGIIMDTNPPDDTHWWYGCAEENSWAVDGLGERVDPDTFPDVLKWSFFSQPSGMSPEAENVENLVEGYYQRLIAGKDKEWINVYVHGKYGFIRDGKPVYPEWNETYHLAEKEIELIKNRAVYVGLDFGRTPCAIFGQKTDMGGWNILRELITEDMDIETFADILHQDITEYCPDNEIFFYGDPAGTHRVDTDSKTAFGVLRIKGIHAKPAPGNNKLNTRLQSVKRVLNRNAMGRPAFQLDKRCKIIRRGFNGGYKFKALQVSGDDRIALEPDKNQFSHPHDGLQYLLMGGGEFSEMKGRNRKIKQTVMKNDWSAI